MSDCAMIRDDLKAYVDNELSAARRLVVRIHLARCGSCRKELAMLVRIAEELRSRDAGSLDAALRYRILADAVEVTSQQRQAGRPRQLWRPRSLPAWGAAAAAVLIVAACYPLLDRDVERVLSTGFAPTAATKAGPAASGSMAGARSMGKSPAVAGPSKSAPLGSLAAPGPSRTTVGADGGAAARPTVAELRKAATGAPVASNSLLVPSDRSRSAAALGYGVDGHASAMRAAPTPSAPGGPAVPTPSLGLDGAGPDGVAKSVTAPMGRATDHVELVARPHGNGDVMSNVGPTLADALSAGSRAERRLSMELGVDVVETKAVAVARIVRDVNGAVDDQRLYKAVGAAPNAVIEMRVPTERADEVMKKLRTLGEVLPAGQAACAAYGSLGSQDYAFSDGARRSQAAPGAGQGGMGGGFGGFGGGQGGMQGRGGQGGQGGQFYSDERMASGLGGQAAGAVQGGQLREEMSGQQGVKGDAGQQASQAGFGRSVAQGKGPRGSGQAQEEAGKQRPDARPGQSYSLSPGTRAGMKAPPQGRFSQTAASSQGQRSQAALGRVSDADSVRQGGRRAGGQAQPRLQVKKDRSDAEKAKALALSGGGQTRAGVPVVLQQAGGQTIITVWLRQRVVPAAAAKPAGPAQRR